MKKKAYGFVASAFTIACSTRSASWKRSSCIISATSSTASQCAASRSMQRAASMLRRQRKMRPVATPKLRSFVAATALVAAVAAVFWTPALAASRGYFPAPLDDVYIHFDFARSLARGHPFEWLPGNGYSSGETSPLYAVVLAAGWLVGFRGRMLGVWAAIVAVLATASFVRSAQTIARPCSRWIAGGIAVLVLSVGIVDWSLFSGMELATFAAALGRALV